jgi:ribosomal protein L9
MAPMTEIKPATKEDAERISKEMKEVTDNVKVQVAESMKLFESFIAKYVLEMKRKS